MAAADQEQANTALIPPDFICPITQEVMQEPVIALDGHSYERVAIEQWFSSGRRTSPLTNAQMGSSHLTPNHTLRKGKKRCYPSRI